MAVGRFRIGSGMGSSMRMRSLALSMMAAAVAVLAAAGSASAATPAHKGGGGGGTGGAPASISISPGSMTFGPQELGTESDPQFFTITNTGSATEAIYIRFADADGTTGSGDFNSLAAAGCDEPDTLAPGASCTEPISFAPISAGLSAEVMDVAVGSFNGTPVASATITGTFRSQARLRPRCPSARRH
jgi:hypothetical protein